MARRALRRALGRRSPAMRLGLPGRDTDGVNLYAEVDGVRVCGAVGDLAGAIAGVRVLLGQYGERLLKEVTEPEGERVRFEFDLAVVDYDHRDGDVVRGPGERVNEVGVVWSVLKRALNGHDPLVHPEAPRSQREGIHRPAQH